jgi:hypothetical protein
MEKIFLLCVILAAIAIASKIPATVPPSGNEDSHTG